MRSELGPAEFAEYVKARFGEWDLLLERYWQSLQDGVLERIEETNAPEIAPVHVNEQTFATAHDAVRFVCTRTTDWLRPSDFDALADAPQEWELYQDEVDRVSRVLPSFDPQELEVRIIQEWARAVAGLPEAEQQTCESSGLPKHTTNRGNRHAKKWHRARAEMLRRLDTGTLPESLRKTGRLLGQSYVTTRTAAQRSKALCDHYSIEADKNTTTPSTEALVELAASSDRRTQQLISRLDPDRRETAAAELRNMTPAKRLKLRETLGRDPDAGSTGDVYLNDNVDQDSSAGDSSE
ncbi:MAG: hypothetical protein ABIK89_23350 [Planctomycetota bacterium]